MLTRLGENVTTASRRPTPSPTHYLGLLDTIAERGIDGEVSVKLTQLGFDIDRDLDARPLRSVWPRRRAARADALGRHGGQRLRRRARSSSTSGCAATHPNMRLCLQAYLRRTARRPPAPAAAGTRRSAS